MHKPRRKPWQPDPNQMASGKPGAVHALFGLILAHMGVALVHGLIRRDGGFSSMAPRLTASRFR